MNRLLTLAAVLALAGAGCITVVEPGDQTHVEPTGQIDSLANDDAGNDELNGVLTVACVETGGDWYTDDATCVCADDTSLDEDSGECLTGDGTPGGKRGETLRAKYELMVACKETAGIYDDETHECTCPDEDTLNPDSGECLTQDDEPDGIRGQEAKEQRFKANCEVSGGTYSNNESACICPNAEADDNGNCPTDPGNDG
jgi:hypothetical protein